MRFSPAMTLVLVLPICFALSGGCNAWDIKSNRSISIGTCQQYEIKVLKKRLEDPDSTNESRQTSAECLEKLIGKESGSWIAKGLSLTRDMNTGAKLVGLLAKTGHNKATPLSIEWAIKNTNDHERYKFIRALFLYAREDAADVVRKLCEGKSLYAKDIVHSENMYMHISYERAEHITAFECRNFLGPWGKPDKNVRVQLVPPKTIRVGEPIYFSLIFDNGSDYGLSTPREWDIEYIVDGEEYPYKTPEPDFMTGFWQLPSRNLQMSSYRFPSTFQKAGKHAVQFKWSYGEVFCNKEDIPTDRKPISGTVYSNVVEIEVVE